MQLYIFDLFENDDREYDKIEKNGFGGSTAFASRVSFCGTVWKELMI